MDVHIVLALAVIAVFTLHKGKSLYDSG